MKWKPLSDRVLVRREASKDRTESGLYLPDTAQKRMSRGEVLAVGPGRLPDNPTYVNGDLWHIPMKVKVGDVVLFVAYAGNIVEDDENLLVMSEHDLLAVLDK